MKLKTTSLAAIAALALVGSASAATVLYSENFNGEGTNLGPPGDYTDGTTPEINVNGIGVLQSSGAHQAGNAGDTAWNLTGTGVGNSGLRFGASSYNWATGSNAATILTAGGFSVSFDYTVGDGGNWVAVRVGNGGENSQVNAADVTFGALAQGNGQMQTFDNAAPGNFGTASANATRSAQFDYAFTSWAAGSTVTFTGKIDGNTVATDTFTWNASNDMKIVLSGYQALSTGGNTMDNLVVSTIPEPSAAALAGLAIGGLLLRRRRA